MNNSNQLPDTQSPSNSVSPLLSSPCTFPSDFLHRPQNRPFQNIQQSWSWWTALWKTVAGSCWLNMLEWGEQVYKSKRSGRCYKAICIFQEAFPDQTVARPWCEVWKQKSSQISLEKSLCLPSLLEISFISPPELITYWIYRVFEECETKYQNHMYCNIVIDYEISCSWWKYAQ